jgi:hypothetical protein
MPAAPSNVHAGRALFRPCAIFAVARQTNDPLRCPSQKKPVARCIWHDASHSRPEDFKSGAAALLSTPARFMTELKNLDLSQDANACRVVKNETVSVEFATAEGELMSLEGPNRYVHGDALITGSTGERWVVSRERFDAKYIPADAAVAHGQAGAYRNRPAVVLAKQMHEAFSLARSANGGDVLRGAAGDWIMQYAPGDYGVVQAARFAKVYRLAD